VTATDSAAAAALQQALAAENSAVYGYGVAGAHLTGARRAAAVRNWVGHQNARDALTAMLAARGAQPVAARPPGGAAPWPFPGSTCPRPGLPDRPARAAARLPRPATHTASRPRHTRADPGYPQVLLLSTCSILAEASSRSAVQAIRSAQDHQNHQVPSWPRQA
jgi:hypothetical protein